MLRYFSEAADYPIRQHKNNTDSPLTESADQSQNL